jgi:uncharacterized protein YuzB (UPF0349 family)
MFKPMIEFCASNMHHGTDEIMQRFEQDDRFEVVEYGCLGNCGECYLNPFALVDGAIVSAETAEELYANVLKALDQQKADQAALDKLLDDM